MLAGSSAYEIAYEWPAYYHLLAKEQKAAEQEARDAHIRGDDDPNSFVVVVERPYDKDQSYDDDDNDTDEETDNS